MTCEYTASISREGDLFVAQCLEVDVASQGDSESEALDNLREALELYFGTPQPTPRVRVKLPTFGRGGLLPGVDLDDNVATRERLESERDARFREE